VRRAGVPRRIPGRAGGPQRGGERVEVAIEAVGARGDGIARLGDVRVFVPLTLPGDRLTVRLGAPREGGFVAEPLAWHEQVPRAVPRCPHFGACGGCQLQHLEPAAAAAWRTGQVATALARRGLHEIAIEAPLPLPPATRRRARLAFERRGGQVALGFRGRAGHHLVDVEACAVVLPGMVGLLPPLRTALAGLPLAARGGEVLVTASDGGLDLVLLTAAAPGLADREGIAALAQRCDLARVSWQRAPDDEPEVVVQRRPVRATFEQVAVELPPGAFLQASAQAEAQIRAAVCAAIGAPGQDPASLADLFAGCGTFGLPLAAAGCRVHAVDAQADMLAALAGAAHRAGFAERVTTEVRDLERAPLAGPELDRFAAVILDPPRAGARAQALALAASNVPCIAMVSCNPASFARDARVLVDGGFALTAVRLIDAFLWSAQIELVGSFARP
jgi:23S rRNA (uracil1939-C5)-methyltransferase